MSSFPLRLKKTWEFDELYESLRETDKVRIDARLDNLKLGNFGTSRSLGEGLLELKWKSGIRVYYSRKRIAGADVIVLWCGFKGTQDLDIAKARKIKQKYEAAFQD